MESVAPSSNLQNQPLESNRIELANESLKCVLYPPDAKIGYYRGSRFDLSGLIGDLRFNGHRFYGPWYSDVDSSVLDYEYRDDKIVAGPSSAAPGPAQEFPIPLGYEDAASGGRFLKIGVGVMKRSDTSEYHYARLYDLIDPGVWSVAVGPREVTFNHQINDSGLGYGYEYEKTVKLATDAPELIMTHKLRNAGAKDIRTSVYNHNFTVIDGQPISPATQIQFRFQPILDTPGDLVETRGPSIVFRRGLTGEDRVYTRIIGFSKRVEDYDIRIENSAAKVGLQVTANRPLADLSLWSIRSVFGIEPFIDLALEAGKKAEWEYRYRFFNLT